MSNDRFLLLQIPFELKKAAIESEYPVYATRIGKTWIAYRVLSYEEYRKSIRAKNILDHYSYSKFLTDKCIIYPDVSRLLALWIPKIAEHIEEVSGFDNMNAFYSALNKSREELTELEFGIDIFLKTILGLDDEKLKSMSYLERMRLVAFAELVSEKEIPGPEKEKKKQSKTKFSEDGIPGLGKKQYREDVLSTDKMGRPTMTKEQESFTVYNTKLKKK